MDKDKVKRRGDAYFDIPPCQLERAHQAGTLRITPDIVEVRAKHSATLYALPITTVAEMIVAKVAKANLQEKGISAPRPRR